MYSRNRSVEVQNKACLSNSIMTLMPSPVPHTTLKKSTRAASSLFVPNNILNVSASFAEGKDILKVFVSLFSLFFVQV